MGHNNVTHTQSKQMRNPPYTILRNGVFHLNYRFPQDLIKAGLIKNSHERRSLKTKNRAEAKAKAIREVALLESEVEKLRRTLNNHSSSEDDLHGRVNSGKHNSLRLLSDLSKAEQRDLALKWFIEMEQKSEVLREDPIDPDDPEERQDVIETAKTDLAVFEETSPFHSPFNWKKELKKLLKREGINHDQDRDAEELLMLLKKATIENKWRTLATYEDKKFIERDPVFKGAHSRSITQSYEDRGHTVGEICAKFPERKNKGRLSPATIVSYTVPIRAFEEFFCPNKPLSELTFEDGEKMVRFLSTIPRNATKRYPSLSLPQAAKREAKKNTKNFIAPKTQKLHFNTIKAILNYAAEIQWIDRNPFSGRALADLLPEPKPNAVIPFTSEDLNRLFRSSMFLEERGRIGKNGELSEGRFWVPLLCLYHGLRANEAASLLACDVKEAEDVHYLSIRETDDSGNRTKRLKNSSSERTVPLHKELIHIGFLKFVDKRKEQVKENDFLFGELKPNEKTGNRAKVISQWFGRLRNKEVPKCSNDQGSKVFHSFRHAVTDCLRAATESDEKRYSLLGWSEGSSKKNAGYNYGTGFPLPDLKQLVDQIEFPGFDSSFLYPSEFD